jgi:protein-export membrane protein SecD
MLHFERWKIIAIVLTCLAGIILAMPNLFSKQTVEGWPAWMPHRQLSLGLDLRGGAHLLLAMDTKELEKDWLVTLRDDVRKQLREGKIGFTGLGVVGDAVQVHIAKPEETDKAYNDLKKLVEPLGNAILGSAGNNIEVEKTGPDLISLRPTPQGMEQRVASAASASVETVRRRVDSLGNIEPNIVRQGQDRILVQVPGFDDTSKLKALIGQTAKLTFHAVHPSMSAEEAKNTHVPFGYKIYAADASDHGGAGSYLLQEAPVVSGEDLVDAQPGFDSRTNEPIISFRFNQSGARKFGRFTKDNVGAPFAIVLDNKVLSAPVIREPILGGSGQISGNFSVESANNLAVQLRSGALPTKLTIVEERTVGPSLGADSIAAGETAGMIGTLAVAGFMIFAYGLFGLFAIIAVTINIILIIAVMSVIGSTLTLPGIAGLVLTIGMAVDANVLIYERIREELRGGKSPISAIDSGFSKAFGTIIDSNLTTLIAGLVMFWLGSGPVRGFAVTLSLGIFATVFTAFTVTRLLVSLWVGAQRSRKIPAPL